MLYLSSMLLGLIWNVKIWKTYQSPDDQTSTIDSSTDLPRIYQKNLTMTGITRDFIFWKQHELHQIALNWRGKPSRKVVLIWWSVSALGIIRPFYESLVWRGLTLFCAGFGSGISTQLVRKATNQNKLKLLQKVTLATALSILYTLCVFYWPCCANWRLLSLKRTAKALTRLQFSKESTLQVQPVPFREGTVILCPTALTFILIKHPNSGIQE